MDDNCSPSSSLLNSSSTRCEKYIINLQKMLNDLISPWALDRLRAIRALKDPTQSSYHYDVPNEMQDIITEEERKTPVKPISFEEVMKDVKVYCDIRSEDGEIVTGYTKDVIKSYGVHVNDRLVKNTTHVIFKKGFQSTYNKAKRLNIPIVSILWIKECKKTMTLVNPTLFKILDLHKYENPMWYRRAERERFVLENLELHPTTNSRKSELPDEKNFRRILSNKNVSSSSDEESNRENLSESRIKAAILNTSRRIKFIKLLKKSLEKELE